MSISLTQSASLATEFSPKAVSNTSAQIVPLDALCACESGIVVELVGSEDQIHRLQELGLREGACVRMVKPGEPCLIAINDQRFSLRLDPAIMILVEVCL